MRCPHGFIHEDLCHTCYVANMEAERAQRRAERQQTVDLRWRIFKEKDPERDHMLWYAHWIDQDGKQGDIRRFHSWDAAVEHVITALS